ncbi:TetR/AcrR family transcriptional regulator [Cupriavidus necator]|uniref:TetR/AcrR family transcriptional regulator n=1 Tax=Cupriavidus necator TaxID=106590 RepID=UPI000A693224|nr:TetR/AcrR family transcriptional regulator [Cupriavidus necator]
MPTQAARSASTRQSLIDAAVTLLTEQGYAAFSEARVAELAGTSRGSLRHYFPDGRYDLLPAMLGWLWNAKPRGWTRWGLSAPRCGCT